MRNGKTIRDAMKAAKQSPAKPDPFKHDVIEDPMGQWKYPGQITKIPSGNITMQGVPYPVYGKDDLGNGQMMYPGMNYTFPGQYVTEYPMAAYGGDPSLPNITGHYPFGGIHSKTHTHMQDGGRLDQYQTRGEVKSYKPKSIEEYNFRKKMYNDSLSLANMSRKINWAFPENPNISKEEYEKLSELEKTYPQYGFAQEQYDIDQKKGKTRDFKDYVTSYYLDPKSSSEPKSVTGYDISEGQKKLNEKYEETGKKYRKSWVDKQGRKHDFEPDDLRGNSGIESIYDPQTGTIVDRYVNYKYPEANFNLYISNKYIKPTETLYKGSKNKKEHGKLSTSSKSTGWYDPNKPKPKFKNISNDEYITYTHEAESRDLFPFPKTKIVKPDPNTPQGEKMTMESYVNNMNKTLDIRPTKKQETKTTSKEYPIKEDSSLKRQWNFAGTNPVLEYRDASGKIIKTETYNNAGPNRKLIEPIIIENQSFKKAEEKVANKKYGGWLDSKQDRSSQDNTKVVINNGLPIKSIEAIKTQKLKEEAQKNYVKSDAYYKDLRKELDSIQAEIPKLGLNPLQFYKMQQRSGEIFKILGEKKPELVKKEIATGQKAGKTMIAAGKYIFPGSAPIFNGIEGAMSAYEFAQDPNIHNTASLMTEIAPHINSKYSTAYQLMGDYLTGQEVGLLPEDKKKKGGGVNPLMRSRSKRASTKKNIQSSINKIFLRNYDLFGPGGKNIYDPKAKYQQGGGWLDNLD